MHRFVLLLPLLFLFACKPSLLPNTSVPDTKFNRAVVDFLGEYRKAFEERNVAGIVALASPEYFDNGGSPDPKKSINYEQLQQKLTQSFEKIESASLQLHVQHIAERDQFVDVVYYFVERAYVKYPAGSQWMVANDVNRMVLLKKGKSYKDGFEVMSGL